MKIRNILLAAAFLGATAGNVFAAETQIKTQVKSQAAKTLDELLLLVKQNKLHQNKENKERIATFLRERNNQRDLLNRAKAQEKAEEDKMNRLKATYEANEKTLSEMADALTLKAGTLGEMVGVVRQVAGDTASKFRRSLISAQFPDRYTQLETLAQANKMPQIPEIRSLWVEMQREMTEQGKVINFTTEIINTEGRPESRNVKRVGVFNLVSDGEYLVFDHVNQDVKQLTRQPVPRLLGLVQPYLDSTGYAALAVDPSRGTILTAETKREGWPERVMNNGGAVGAAIGGVLALGLLIVLERLITLLALRSKMNSQAKSSTPGNNPLGRIMAVYLANKDDDVENLELKLDEAILKETPKIEKRITFIKVLAAVAPLMGLLGTVTGMIETFQSITLYGTGDPKIMAGGISSALITTVLGIVAALPLILTHSVVSGISKGLVHTLEEQSTGLIAQHEEQSGA
jgi:biopolymer transport protein ExbB